MRKISSIPLLALLAACGGGGAGSGDVTLTNASMAEVAARTAAGGTAGAPRFEPGEWETVVTIDQASIPGERAMDGPPKMPLKLAKTSSRNCITPDQAARPDEAIFGGKRGNCRFDRYRMQGGRIDATMRCTTEGAVEDAVVIASKGGYAPRRFDLVNTMTAAPIPGHPKITMTSRVVGKRIGACKG
jgi:hypothetical protein